MPPRPTGGGARRLVLFDNAARSHPASIGSGVARLAEHGRRCVARRVGPVHQTPARQEGAAQPRSGSTRLAQRLYSAELRRRAAASATRRSSWRPRTGRPPGRRRAADPDRAVDSFRDDDGDGEADTWYADREDYEPALIRPSRTGRLPPRYAAYETSRSSAGSTAGTTPSTTSATPGLARTAARSRRAYDLLIFEGAARVPDRAPVRRRRGLPSTAAAT